MAATRQRIVTRLEYVEYYASLNPAGHYFDRDTIRFFRARPSKTGVLLPSGVLLFTESTQNTIGGTGCPRRYSVVAILPEKGAGCEKPFGFEAFGTADGARRALRGLVENEDPAPYLNGHLKYAAKWARGAVDALDGGSGFDKHQSAADFWASKARCRLAWDFGRPGLLLPRARNAIPFEEWTARVAELHPE